MVDPIPADYPRVSPYLCVDGCAKAIEFYTQVFDATERGRMPMPDGRIGHAELQLGDSVIMCSDPYPEIGVLDPRAIGGSATSISVYVTDADATMARALDAGATLVRAVEDQFYGDRSGQFLDPFGHRWSVQTHIEDVSEEEMQRRAAQAFGD